ncbi:MAG: hypothetical protein JXA33_12120 [Anaerolineae bacterium]|nr:hypothetical protein [Anaerolineae bacterium]
MRCLLDKVVARYILTGLLKSAKGEDITEEELFSLDLFARAPVGSLDLFIVLPSAQVLRRLLILPRYTAIVQYFQARVEIAFPTRYYKRWARRLRECNFSREDAAVLALATFGTDESGAILGMHFVATYDRPLQNNCYIQRDVIQNRLATMQRDIPAPYCETGLPQVLQPEQIVI